MTDMYYSPLCLYQRPWGQGGRRWYMAGLNGLPVGKGGKAQAYDFTGSMSAGTVRPEPGEAPATVFCGLFWLCLPGEGPGGGVVGRPRGGLPSCWQRSLSAGSSESAHAEIRHVANPEMRCGPKRRGQNAAQQPAALFSPLAGRQGP